MPGEKQIDTASHEPVLSIVQENENRLKTIIENAPDAFFAHDLNGRLVQVNEKACEFMGYSRSELLSMSVYDFQRGLEPEQAAILWQKIMQGETVKTEDLLLRKDGSTFPVEITAALFQYGTETQIFGFIRDITERKRAEAEKERLIGDLQNALKSVRKLSGLLPICSNCHQIRDDRGYWNKLEAYIQKHSEVLFSHSICPACAEELYQDEEWYRKRQDSESSET
ncbi:MAG: PAS domain S-box protein [Thermodesulfobacteriota bacterium]